MPLMKFDVIEGRTDAEIKTLLDAAHRAMVAASRYRSATATRSSRSTNLRA
jgi:hypothetical protein